jgi:hypothetical protein
MIHGSTFEGRGASLARRPACIAALRFLSARIHASDNF